MAICPKCEHQFKEPIILTFSTYKDWEKCLHVRMPGTTIIGDTNKSIVRGRQHTLAEWCSNQMYGYITERRHNHLKRLTYKNKWGIA